MSIWQRMMGMRTGNRFGGYGSQGAFGQARPFSQQFSPPQSQQWTDENRRNFMRPVTPIYQDPNLNSARQTAMDNWRTDYGVPTFKPISEAAFGEAAGRYGATNNSVGTWPMLGQNPAPARQPVLEQFRPSNQMNNTMFSSRSGVSSAAGNGATNSMIVRALRGF